MRKFGRAGLVVAVAGMLSACTAIHPPATSLPSRDSITPGQTISVQGNQNVYAVAQQYHVSMREIIVLNNLKPPFTLRSGQQLVLPAGNSGAVYSTGGYGSNYITPGYGSGSSPPPPIAASSGVVESAALPPVQTQSLQPVELPPVQPNPANNAPTSLAPVVTIPSSVATYTNTPKPAPVGRSAVDSLNIPAAPPKPVTTTVTAAVSSSVSAPASSSADGIPSGNVSMIWPVQGPVVSKFGPKGQGLNNDGVNISAPKGSPVVAAANGIVVYAGNEMKGFGNLILIRHQGGWVTAYAHLDRMLVAKDAVVAQGDMIGTVGKTGNVPSPQLHFETRFKDKPVDPSGVVKTKMD